MATEFESFLRKINATALSPPSRLSPVSGIIATYNRCPFEEGRQRINPLSLCLDSILSQTVKLDELIVINDASTDNTLVVLANYERQFNNQGIKLTKINSPINQGVCQSRNQGMKIAQNDIALIIDDDCILHPRFVEIYGGLLTELVQDQVAILQPATYTQSRIPTGFIDQQRIGVFDIEKGEYLGNFDRIPTEHKKLQRNGKIDFSKPLPVVDVSEFAAIGLIHRPTFLLTGGYRDFPKEIKVTNAFGAESEIALDLKRLGYRTVMCPDPRVFDVHLRFGSPPRMPFFQTLNQEEQECIRGGQLIQNTGLRCPNTEWCYNKIASYYFVFSRNNLKGAEQWKNKTFQQFVELNQPEFYSKGVPFIEERVEREKIWLNAINTVDSYLSK